MSIASSSSKKESKADSQRLRAVVDRVIDDVRPSKSEIDGVIAISNNIAARIKKLMPKDTELVIVGSMARGTQVKGSYDVDMFLLYPRNFDEKLMERMTLDIAKKIIDKNKGESFTIKYAQHPYARINVGGVDADIVPAYKINSILEKGTAVDRTPLHNEFILSHLSARQKDEVRVMKAFLKAQGIYGAEVSIEGFSGYLCELLIHTYGSFEALLKAVVTARLPWVLDPKESARIEPQSETASKLVKKFLKEIVVIDPTDSNRNVAAALSIESFSRFVLAAKKLLATPSIEVFYGKGYSDAYAKNKLERIAKSLDCDVYTMAFGLADIAADIKWQQLKRLNRSIQALMKKNGFAPIIALQDMEGDHGILSYFMNRHYNGSRTVEGPSVFLKGAAELFCKVHSKSYMYLDADRVMAIEKPEYKDAMELLKGINRSKEISKLSHIRVREAKFFSSTSMPEDYARLVYRSFVKKTSLRV